MDNKNFHPPRQAGLRRLPGWRLAAMIRRSGYRQSDIALRARTTQGEVSNTIYRILRGTPKSERIWQALEEMLNANGHES